MNSVFRRALWSWGPGCQRGLAKVRRVLRLLSGCIWLELSALDHRLQHGGDLTFFTVEHVENLPKFVPLLLNFIAKIQEPQGTHYDRQDWDFFSIHENSW